MGAYDVVGTVLIALYSISFNPHINRAGDTVIIPVLAAEENERQEGQGHCQKPHSRDMAGKASNEL